MIGLTRLLVEPPRYNSETAQAQRQGIRRIDCDNPEEARLIACWYRNKGWSVEEQEL